MKRTTLLLSGLALGGGVFALDRWTKILFFGRGTVSIIGRFLETTSHHNLGLIADVAVPHILIILFTALIAVIVCWGFCRSVVNGETLRSFSLAIILGGALGNLFDRLTYGFVFDWIMFFQWSILNIADIAIGAGILLFIYSIESMKKVRE